MQNYDCKTKDYYYWKIFHCTVLVGKLYNFLGCSVEW